jgi:hypothetical protein
MTRFLGLLRLLALAVAVIFLFTAGESHSAGVEAPFAASPSFAAKIGADVNGAALVLGAYGFLFMLRRRSLH